MDVGLNLFTGNRLEILAQALSKVLEAPMENPLEPDVVVLQSQGMARWLSIALSSHNGICANIRWRFPNAFIQDMFALAVPDLAGVRRFDAKSAAWKIMGFLPQWVEEPVFAPLAHYLGRDDDPLKRYQIAELLADTLDQYLTYRPDMIDLWETGADEDFQAVLYRNLLSSLKFSHRIHLMKAFKRWVKTHGNKEKLIPGRVCVFGISSLPEFHMDLLTTLSSVCQVNLFLLNPCPLYWGDILSESEKKRLKAKGGGQGEAALLMEGGNPLLASMGGQGREFFDMVAERGLEEFPLFSEPGDKTLLGMVQADIYNLRDRTQEGEAPFAFDPSDLSFTLHNCHSPLREVEVLRDALLSMMDKDSGLRPSDVLVMAPDINAYGAVIEAVFNRRVEGEIRLPFSIADQANKSGDNAVEAFLLLLDLAGFRFEAAGVMELLENEAIRTSFGLVEGDLEQVGEWIRQTAIRWGVDGEQRMACGTVPFEENSWKAGLDRLFTGYAVGGDARGLFGGTLAAGPVEGEQGPLLGRLAHFMGCLTRYVKALDRPRTAGEWVVFFDWVLATFLMDEAGEAEGLQGIRETFYRMGEAAGEAENEEPVDFSVVRFILKTALGAPDPAAGFITSGITFCAMLPMRSIPFKVVCILGMGYGTFPRQHHAPSFDLIAAHPRRGDRSRRKDDRYLFQEILLSVRERLWISYTGQSIRDNSPLQPSVLLSELLDYVDGAVKGGVSHRIVVTHPLHPFSGDYFGGEEASLFTYDAASRRVAGRMAEPLQSPPPFAPAAELGAASVPPDQLSLDELDGFFAQPSRYLLRDCLGMELKSREEAAESCEPFALNGLARHRAGSLLFEALLEGVPLESPIEEISAMGILPRGEVGHHLLTDLLTGARAVSEALIPFTQGLSPLFERRWVDLSGGVLAGEVGPRFGETLVGGRFGMVRGQDLISLWLRLLLGASAGLPVGRAVFVGLDGKSGRAETIRMAVPPNPHAVLDSLVRLFVAGGTGLVPLFPLASHAYAREMVKSGDESKAMAKAAAAFKGSPFSPVSDLSDPWIKWAVRGQDPLNSGDFSRCADLVYRPILEASTL